MKMFFALAAIILAFSMTACNADQNSDVQNNTSSGFQQISAPVSESLSSEENGSSSENVSEEDTDTVSDSKSNILIVYFTAAENSGVDAVASASVVTVDGTAKGVSQAIADMIAEKTGGDMFSIRTSVVYPAGIGELIDYVAVEQKNGDLPEITTHIEGLDSYDTVFIGFPIWWYDMPQIMYTFFNEYDFSGKKIIPFTVHNGSRLSGTPAKIAELEPDADVIQDGFTVSIQSAADAAEDVAKWLEELGY